MKKSYFEFIQIDKEILVDFINQHKAFTFLVNPNEPFFVRIYKKPYSGLIHTILSQNESSEKVQIMWNQLHDFGKVVKPKAINKIPDKILVQILGQTKTQLVKQITKDVLNKTLNLKKIKKSDEQTIIEKLKHYPQLDINSVRLFTLFACFKQNILCDTDPDFTAGLKLFLKKENITDDDINNIRNEYQGQLSLFSLCIWKIKNTKAGK